MRHRPGRAALGAAVLLFCSASASSAPAQGPAPVPADQRAAIEPVIQEWDPYSLDPTGIAFVVKAYKHKVCKG